MQQSASEFSIVERKWKIMEVLRERGTVNVSALSDTFQVSLSTIRRDLDKLEREGFLTKAYGGAYLREPLARERSLTERLTTQSAAKKAIAAVAAGMIQPGETFILGSGTTCQCLAHSLPADLPCTVITNDIRLAAELCQPSKITVITTGGQIDKDSAVAYGSIAEQLIARINVDKALFSVMGFSVERGLTHALLEIASYKRRVIASARQLIVLIDSQKIGRVFPYLITSPDELHTVITDEDAPSSFVGKLEALGVQVIVAKYSRPKES
jgi:DeoR/GlpR family transcriptional regulator of sugar metabolism